MTRIVLPFTDCSTEKMIENLLDEGLNMRNLDHEHVMKLSGICLDRKEDSEVIQSCLVLPFMSNGDLLSYIHQRVIKNIFYRLSIK